jgi:transcription initiation factor TFIIH subunit 4
VPRRATLAAARLLASADQIGRATTASAGWQTTAGADGWRSLEVRLSWQISPATMETQDAGGNRLKLKRTQVKRESEDAMQIDDEADQTTVKREVIDIDDDDNAPAAAEAPAAAVKVEPRNTTARARPSFTVSDPSSAAAASSSSSVKAASSSPAAAASGPVVQNQATMRLSRLKKRPKSILDYLCSLEKSVLDALYEDTFTCLTIFRSLHPLAKQYLLRWLCITDPLPISVVNSWVLATPTSQQAHTQAMNTLWELQLLIRTTADGSDAKTSISSDETYLIFNPPFQKCLQNALSNKLAADAFGAEGATAADHDRPSLDHLEEYAQSTWQSILHWMIGASGSSTSSTLKITTPNVEVTNRLVSMGMMEPLTRDHKKPMITPTGFAFLFKDQQTQVWDVVLAYMDGLREQGMDRDQVLQFLFRLSFLKLGMGYPTDTLTPTQQRLLHDLTSFGLIYMRAESRNANRGPHMYYPTKLALNLSSSTSTNNAATASASGVVEEGYLILETTFRLYAFTTSPFNTALLGLFCRLDIALPNLLIGTITKESVRHALKHNISSGEIIKYLESYAKADMKVNTPVLPENVTDQIRLWEQERNRMSLTESYLFEFDGNDTEQVVNLVLTEAFKQADQILLHHAQKKLLVVTPDGYARLKAYKLALNAEMARAAQLSGKQV